MSLPGMVFSDSKINSCILAVYFYFLFFYYELCLSLKPKKERKDIYIFFNVSDFQLAVEDL